MKRTFIMVLAAVLALTLVVTGCGTSSGGAQTGEGQEQTQAQTPAQSGDKIRVGYVMLNFTNTFYANLMETAQMAADDRGFEVIFKSCENSLEQEIAMIENFIQEGVDVIIADPIDSDALVDVFTQGAESGICRVSLFNEVKTPDSVTTYNAMLDHGAIFEGMCMGLAAKMEGTGKIGYIAGTPGNEASDLRRAGLYTMLEKYPGMELIAEEPCDFDPNKGLSIFETWLTAYPEMDVVVCVFDDVAPAIVEMIDQNNADILVAANDGLRDCIVLVDEGKVVTDTLINGYRAGYWSALYSSNIASGKTNETHEYMPTYVVIPTNIQEMMKAEGTFDDYQIITPQEALNYIDNVADEFANY